MTVLKKLHLNNGLEKNSVEVYKKHIANLDKLTVDVLKRFLGIYSVIIDQIEEEFQLREDKGMDSIKNRYVFEDRAYQRNKKYRQFLRYRIREDNLTQFIGERWLAELENTKIELKSYSVLELIDCSVKAYTMLQIIDTLITQKEPLWSPYSVESIKFLEKTDFEFVV